MHRLLATGRLAVAILLAVLGAAAPSTAEEQGPPVRNLERAPRDLGAARADGMLLLRAAPAGKDLYLLDIRSGTLSRYGEGGHLRDDPVVLRTADGGQLPQVLGLAVSGQQVALMTSFAIMLYKTDGEHIATKQLFFAGDIAPTKLGVWTVSLVNAPADGIFVGRDEFEGLPPRIIELGSKLKLGRAGFPVEEGDNKIAAGRAVGRTLNLAWSGDRLYAAELANYTVTELGRDLKPRAIFREPKLELETGLTADNPAAVVIETQAEGLLARQPGDADKPQSSPTKSKGSFESFNYHPVIRDIAWGSHSNRLAILLQRDVVDGGPVLDLLDPATGEVERFRLRFPEGGEGEQPLTQLAVGEDYLWLRAHPGKQPTWRISHASLIDGQRLTLPEVTFLATDEPEAGEE